MEFEKNGELIAELMKVVKNISNKPNATPEEVTALAEVAHVIVECFKAFI